MVSEPDHYAVLGISRAAPPAVVKAAYYKLMMASHPDRNSSALAEAGRRSAEITAAFRVLGDPERRVFYDSQVTRQLARRNALAAHPNLRASVASPPLLRIMKTAKAARCRLYTTREAVHPLPERCAAVSLMLAASCAVACAALIVVCISITRTGASATVNRPQLMRRNVSAIQARLLGMPTNFAAGDGASAARDETITRSPPQKEGAPLTRTSATASPGEAVRRSLLLRLAEEGAFKSNSHAPEAVELPGQRREKTIQYGFGIAGPIY